MHESSTRGGPFRWLARFALRRSGLIVAVCALIMLAGGLVLVRGGRLSAGTTEGIESDIAQRIIEDKLAYPGDSSFIVLLRAHELTPGDPRFTEALRAALAPLRADPRVRAVLAPDDAPQLVAERLQSTASRSALAVVSLKHDFSVAAEEYPELRALVRSPDFDVGFTGNLAFRYDLNETNGRDLLFAELLSLPLAMLVLLVVFRSAAAAALSVGVGALAVTTGIAIVTALSHVMDLAVYAVNVASLVGLGVAIDYSLFIVSRYRDELADGAALPDALETAMDTSGRAVVFSGIAVAIGLGSLLFFRGSFLAGLGLAAGIVVMLAIGAALTFLPALLVTLGPRIDAGHLPLPRLIDTAGMWHRLATWVMQRPVTVLLPTLAFLIALGLPFVRLTMAAADVQTLPRGVAARDVYEQLREAFPDQARTRIQIVIRYPDGAAYTPERIGQIYDLAQRYRQLPGVVKFEGVVDSDDRLTRDYFTADAEMPDDWLPPDALKMRSMVASDGVALLTLLTDAAPASRQARDIVHTIRRDPRLGDGTLLVTGATAHDLDISEFTLSRAPWAIGFILVVTGAALFILLRSIVLPLKAVVMNLLSITASFGALVWIFEDGHLASLLHFEHGPIDPTVPTLLFCCVFGLSMDYEVLMLSRMREEYLRTGDNTWAVAEGLERTGRLVTSAAAIMVVVFASFGLASVVVVKAIGISLALAVALDATLVRCLIVPATMRLFGDWNWWAPRWLGGGANVPNPTSFPEPQMNTDPHGPAPRGTRSPAPLRGRGKGLCVHRGAGPWGSVFIRVPGELVFAPLPVASTQSFAFPIQSPSKGAVAGMFNIERVVVLGANGTMGAGSAEVFAAGGCDVVLLARSTEKAREGLVGAQNMAKSITIGNRMSVGTYDGDFTEAVGKADLIFEALAEDMEIKKAFFDRVDKIRRPDSIVATVSSGLSIAGMAKGRSESFRKNFLGVHLFNPPSVIVGTEVIPHDDTDPKLVTAIVEMLERRFGRVVTLCRDLPAFAGNRVGFKVLNECAQLAAEHGVAFVDYLIGPYTGRAMPPLSTVDLVGWDVHRAIVDNVHANTDDEAHDAFQLPTYVAELIEEGHLGNKTPERGGFYRRTKEDGKNVNLVLDPKTGGYKLPADQKVAPLPFVEKMRQLHNVGRYQEAFKVFLEAKGAEADLARKVVLGYVSYALNRVGETEVVRDASDVDKIMGFGFNWAPPTVLADVMGIKATIAAIEKAGLPVPKVLAGAKPDQRLFNVPGVNVGRFFAA